MKTLPSIVTWIAAGSTAAPTFGKIYAVIVGVAVVTTGWSWFGRT